MNAHGPHLDDGELALIVHGMTADALSDCRMEHLAACGRCREELGFILGAEAILACRNDRPRLEDGIDPATSASLKERFARLWATAPDGQAPLRLMRLRSLPGGSFLSPGEGWRSSQDGPVPALPLAADTSADRFPVLYLDEPELSIAFDQAEANGPIRAHVIRVTKAQEPGHRIYLRLPAKDLTIPIPADGEVDLVGVAREDLEGAILGIEPGPLPGEPAD